MWWCRFRKSSNITVVTDILNQYYTARLATAPFTCSDIQIKSLLRSIKSRDRSFFTHCKFVQATQDMHSSCAARFRMNFLVIGLSKTYGSVGHAIININEKYIVSKGLNIEWGHMSKMFNITLRTCDTHKRRAIWRKQYLY